MSKVYGIKEDKEGRVELTEQSQGLGQSIYFLTVTENMKVARGKLSKSNFTVNLLRRGEQNQILHTWSGSDRQTTLERACHELKGIIDARRGNQKK